MSLIAMVVIALLAALLYIPFLKNGFVFDDHGLFANGSVYDYVERPFDFSPRSFPYFTLGIIAVISNGIELNRIFSLILHIMCGGMLYVLLRALLLQAKESVRNEQKNGNESKATLAALIGACWFVIHPVAVYGAGYLAQRTILFATLFSLLSLWFYRRAFSENRTADIFTAALFYSLAVFSKEHAIMLPFTSIALISLYEGGFRSRLKRAALYLALCAPAAIFVFFAKKQIVATGYEPDIATIISQISDIGLLSTPIGKWIVSAVLQTKFFFEYLFLWIIPDIRQLSIDMRFDFSHIWFSWGVFPNAIFFCLSPV
ncbi:MAG TPA: hypothetical protein VN114_13420, partial [Oxalicibacterium sp.]|nr:hypothetical protein [Oxalicibacterium sp.]